MRNYLKYCLLICLILIFTSCGSALRYPNGIELAAPQYNEPESISLEQYIWSEVETWQGVPYKWGGNNLKGVDCSGLTVAVFRNLFGIKLPRTTSTQVRIGKPVKQHQLRPGDLVFFISPEKSRHVGIYLGNKKFTHASDTKNKVIVSRLDTRYWQKTYWTSRRVIPENFSYLVSQNSFFN